MLPGIRDTAAMAPLGGRAAGRSQLEAPARWPPSYQNRSWTDPLGATYQQLHAVREHATPRRWIRVAAALAAG